MVEILCGDGLRKYIFDSAGFIFHSLKEYLEGSWVMAPMWPPDIFDSAGLIFH
jgi:hypothetical protein